MRVSNGIRLGHINNKKNNVILSIEMSEECLPFFSIYHYYFSVLEQLYI